MKSLSTTLIIFLSLAFASLALASMNNAKQAINEGNYQEAISTLETLLAADANNTEAHYTLAQAKGLLAQTLVDQDATMLYREAVEHARVAVDLAPNDAQSHVELGIALGRLSQHIGILESINIGTEMKAVVDRALELKPDHFEVYHLLAIWHLEAPWLFGGRSELVVPYFEQSIALNPNNIMLYVDFAESLVRLNETEAAKVQLDKALTMPAKTALDEFDLARAEALRVTLP